MAQEIELKFIVAQDGVETLREQLNASCKRKGIRVHYPELHLCTDNGAMIAMAGAMRLQAQMRTASKAYAFDVKPRWPLAELSSRT